MEGDLAALGVDLRDLYRPGPVLTFRRLRVLVRALPFDAQVWIETEAAEEAAKIPKRDKIKERQEYWRARGH